MRAEQLRVELYPRSPWEAMELGTALVRSHARAIWLPWLLVTLPILAIINGVALALGWAGWAALAMWWLKPVFERIPLYVLSRAVFGDAPRVRETLRAQWRWGWRPMWAYLTWRRLGPARALFLPVDLLEGGNQPAQRRQVIGSSVRGTAAMLILVCANFELALVLAVYALAMLFVPLEYFSETARAAWALMSQEPPPWLLVVGNVLVWFGSSVIEPFYVGAGFGMYLDRRTRLEAWDVEIAFRRLRARLLAAAAAVAWVGIVLLPLGVTQAQDKPAATPQAADTLVQDVFGQVRNDPAFARAVAQTRHDPLLHPERKQTVWVAKNPADKREPTMPDSALLRLIAKVVGVIGEYGLWLLAALLLALLVGTWRHWWPWLHGRGKSLPRLTPSAISEMHLVPEVLPADIVGSVRKAWQKGRQRRALALLYRAGVEAMVVRTGAVLVPGATEAECLRAARALPEAEDRDAFTGMVRIWQYAAYAQRLPDEVLFEQVLMRLATRFGWMA